MASPDMNGPFETERQARELPAVRAIYEAYDRDPGPGRMAPHNWRLLVSALAAADIHLDEFDHRIVVWLAGWEPTTVAVIAGWVQRASQARDEAGARVDLLGRTHEGTPG